MQHVCLDRILGQKGKGNTSETAGNICMEPSIPSLRVVCTDSPDWRVRGGYIGECPHLGKMPTGVLAVMGHHAEKLCRYREREGEGTNVVSVNH